MATRHDIDSERLGLLSDPTVVNRLQTTIAEKPITFLLGSGISLFPPSSVVNGQLVTKALAYRLSQGTSPQRLIRRAIESSAFEHVLQLNPDQEAARDWLTQLFGATAPNSIHISVARICRDHGAHVITTNYDGLLEAAGRQVGLQWCTLVDEDDEHLDPSAPNLFKIHGSISNRNSLLFTMSHEAPLPSWKASHFDRLTRDRVVIVVGYSGKDFEICPALLGSKANAVIWNVFDDPRKSGFPSENAEHLFANRADAVAVIGDMHHIFQVQPQRPSSVDEALLDQFFSALSPSDFARWQIGLLDSIGAATQAKQLLVSERRHFTRQDISRAKIGIAYRNGRYLSSALHALQTEISQTTPLDDRLFSIAIGTAFRFRNYGAHTTASALFSFTERLLKRVGKTTRRRFRINHSWLHVLILQRQGRPMPAYWRRVRTVAEQTLREGQWGTYYLISSEAEKLGIDAPRRLGIEAPLLPSRQGFKHIGNLSSRIDDFSKDAPQDRPTRRAVLRELLIARRVGLQPNRWKLALASLIFTPNLNFQYRCFLFTELLAGSWRCQYSIPIRLAILYQGVRAFLGLKAKSIL